MTELIAVPDAIRHYGDASAAMAAEVAAVAAADQAATIAAAVPVFGLIGQDFLIALALAQGNNLQSSAEIAAVHAATALTAYDAAAGYEATEDTSAAEFRVIGTD
ncbi:type VII secretion target [Nocardia vinacea]|uniref:Type VII secretion target n=1 Tax=Nocardia vinacea TaxID=96468 RepID=A0ABZ1YXQ4_9NOCA|nr:type VII secretion target [Nocardia vinacea]